MNDLITSYSPTATEVSTGLEGRTPVPLVWNFPKPPRESQTKALEFIQQEEVELASCSLSAPTGSGKSAIAAGLASTYGAAVLVPQKVLQDQYMQTWPNASLLKGSGNYPCKGAVNCRVGARHSKIDKCRQCSCPFSTAKSQFLNGGFAITNYACYFSLRQHDPSFEPSHHALVMDEAHNLERALIDSATLKMTEEMFVKVTKETWKKPHTLAVAMRMMSQFSNAFMKEKMPPSPFWTEVEEMVDLIGFVFERIDEDGMESWILCSEKDSFRVCPVESNALFGRYLGGKWSVLMTATPPPADLLDSWLGENHGSLELPSTFPLQNRPVRYVPVEKLNRDTMANLAVQTKLLKRIAAVMDHHSDEKGIIHTTTYNIAQMISDRIRSPRLLIQEPGNREEILEKHLKSKNPTILVSPSMTEGVDLYDDLGRFNIVVKVPFANLGDNWVKARKETSRSWYDWTAMKDLVQAVGRTTRHEKDHSISYILDGSFEGLFNRSSHLFPKWFSDSIHTTWPPSY